MLAHVFSFEPRRAYTTHPHTRTHSHTHTQHTHTAHSTHTHTQHSTHTQHTAHSTQHTEQHSTAQHSAAHAQTKKKAHPSPSSETMRSGVESPIRSPGVLRKLPNVPPVSLKLRAGGALTPSVTTAGRRKGGGGYEIPETMTHRRLQHVSSTKTTGSLQTNHLPWAAIG